MIYSFATSGSYFCHCCHHLLVHAWYCTGIPHRDVRVSYWRFRMSLSPFGSLRWRCCTAANTKTLGQRIFAVYGSVIWNEHLTTITELFTVENLRHSISAELIYVTRCALTAFDYKSALSSYFWTKLNWWYLLTRLNFITVVYNRIYCCSKKIFNVNLFMLTYDDLLNLQLLGAEYVY